MAYKQSVYDKIGAGLAPILRKLNDVKLNFIGTKTQILRIIATNTDYNADLQGDLLGDKTNTYSSEVVDNVYIQYPFNEVELFQMVDGSGENSVGAMSLTELMPIKMIVPFGGTTSTTARDFDQNDIIVDVVKDHTGRKIPLILTAPKLVGTLWNKELVKKTYMLTFFRGKLETEIQTHVDNYISTLGITTVSTTVPATGATGVSINAPLVITFAAEMNTANTSSYITMSPSITLTFAWDTTNKIVTITPSAPLAALTNYVLTISSTILSVDNISMASNYTVSFITGS
jgi:hypothetical protein